MTNDDSEFGFDVAEPIDPDGDDQEESDQEESVDDEEPGLMQLAKAKVLAVVAWVRAEFDQALEEIAPQLRGAFSGVSIPSGAIKPVALAVVLLVAAVAVPAADLGGSDQTAIETDEEPVVGTTYDAPEEGEYRQVVESALGTADANAPAPPSEVRASAGTQTMSVATTIVDGEPAIVLDDDRTHSGRWVSVPTSWFKEQLGEVPSAAHIDHDSGDTYAAPLRVRGDSATFYVKEFSTNTVTFSGEVVLNGDQAGDGTQYQYDLNSTSGIDDPSINLTGVTTTASDTTTTTAEPSGTAVNLQTGGNAPLSGPNGEPTVTFEGVSGGSYNIVEGDGDGSTEDTINAIGDSNDNVGWETAFEFTPSQDVKTSKIDLNIASTYGSDSDLMIDIYIDGGGADATHKEGTRVVKDYDIGFSSGVKTISADNPITLTGGQTYEIDIITTQTNNDNDASWLRLASDDSPSNERGYKDGGSFYQYGDITVSTPTTDSPSIDTDGDGTAEASVSGTLSGGQTVTKELTSLSRSDDSAVVSTQGGTSPTTIKIKSVSKTKDPVVELNGGTTGYSGTLADGETVSLSANNSSLVEGTNQVNISTNSPTSGPASLVGFEYSHSAEETVSATVSETTWSQSTNVSYTWADSRSNASATLPMNDRVAGVRNVEVRTNGSTWSSVSSSSYSLDGTDLVVDLGDVASGETTEVRATGSKIRVTDGSITVLEPTTGSDQLDTRLGVDSAGSNFEISVDETIYADRIHYARNATWGETTGESTISSSGKQSLTLPSATVGGEATVRTWPVEVAPATGSVTVSQVKGDRSEPGFTVRGDGSSEVDYTYVDAADATAYVLYSETNGIARDQGLASSPITLSDDNSDETLFFLVDDGGSTGSGSGTSASAGVAPMEAAGSGFTTLQALIPDTRLLLLGLIGLAAGVVAVRRSGVVDEGTRGAAAVDAGQEVATTAGGLLERVFENEIVVGALVLAGGAWVLRSGVLSEEATLILSLAAVPVALFLALRQFDRFDFRVWIGSTALVAVFGLQALAPELGATIVEEAGVILAVGGLLIAWRVVSAFRAEANTPDQVTRVELETRDNDD